MLLWHVGAVIFLFRWVFRDPRVDLRMLALGAVVIDLADLSVAMAAGSSTQQLLGHTLIAPAAFGAVVLIFTARGPARSRWLAVVIAMLLHLLIDRMWVHRDVFWWPAFGLEIEMVPGSVFDGLAGRMLGGWNLALEVMGAGYLIALLVRHGALSRPGLARLARTGVLQTEAIA